MYKRNIPFILYFTITILCIFLWIPFPDCYHFSGASSLLYLLVFAIGSNNQSLVVLAVCSLPVAVCYLGIATGIALKYRKYSLCYLMMIADLVVTFLCIAHKIAMQYYVGIELMLVGFACRCLYLLWSYQYCRKHI